MDIGSKEKMLIGLGLILCTMIFDWSNYFKFFGLIFIALSLSENKDESSEKSKQ